MIEIKDISKIEKREKVEDTTFREECLVDFVQDIADKYCRSIMDSVKGAIGAACEIKYIGCTERIGNYEFNVSSNVEYSIIFQKDTYEENLQLTVLIGYQQKRVGMPIVDIKETMSEYNLFLEKLKLTIKRY